MVILLNKEVQIQKNIIEVMRNEVKNRETKSMYCCMSIARKVADKMDNVTHRQVWKEMKRMMSNGIILYFHSEPPHIILKKHHEKQYYFIETL